MIAPRIGSLFSGYGGLDMGVTAAIGGSVAWHVEFDKAPSKILAHHWPDVPNYGDVTKVDWSQVEPVDVITGGSPCQDLSHAGKRQGMTEGTRSNLWVAMREAIAQLRPGLVVWENVRGAYSAEANSAGTIVTRKHRGRTNRSVVYEGGLLENADGGPTLRALGRVLGDLSDLGYDCRWHGLRAADIGAPHGRFRVFVVAHAADIGQPRSSACGPAEGYPTTPGNLLPTPTSSDTNGAGQHGDGGLDLRTAVSLLPTPAVNDMGEGKLLPTIKATNNENRPSPGFDNGGEVFYHILRDDRWGEYADAIARWESLTRPAPPPTQPSKKGTPQLSPAFSEWLMGLPEGHVTGVPGLSRNDMLKALGNGVVPQQAAAALRFLLSVRTAA